MKLFKFLIAALILLLAMPEMEAQRGGRGGTKSRSSSSRNTKSRGNEPSILLDKLWFGAGGTLGFSGNGTTSFSSVGLTPMVGYKINEVFSAGPRIGATWNTLKGITDQNTTQRVSLWDFEAGIFARARVFQFYAQTEFTAISRQNPSLDQSFRLVTNDATGKIFTERNTEEQLLVGLGYNPGLGSGISTDIGIFYNLFDDPSNLNSSPFVFRIMLTFNYGATGSTLNRF